MGLCVAACSGGGPTEAEPVPDPPVSGEPGELLDTLTLTTYNILFGGGATPGTQESRAERGYKPEALDDILAILEDMDSDILGLQEVFEWDQDGARVARDVEQRLGMAAVLGPSEGALDVALFTRYEVAQVQR